MLVASLSGFGILLALLTGGLLSGVGLLELLATLVDNRQSLSEVNKLSSTLRSLLTGEDLLGVLLIDSLSSNLLSVLPESLLDDGDLLLEGSHNLSILANLLHDDSSLLWLLLNLLSDPLLLLDLAFDHNNSLLGLANIFLAALDLLYNLSSDLLLSLWSSLADVNLTSDLSLGLLNLGNLSLYLSVLSGQLSDFLHNLLVSLLLILLGELLDSSSGDSLLGLELLKVLVQLLNQFLVLPDLSLDLLRLHTKLGWSSKSSQLSHESSSSTLGASNLGSGDR